MAKLTIIQGTTREIEIELVQEELPVDLTGSTVFFTAKKRYEDPDDNAIIQLDVTDHSDPANGKTILTLTPELTNVKPGKYLYDIKVEFADGSILAVTADALEITSIITQRIGAA